MIYTFPWCLSCGGVALRLLLSSFDFCALCEHDDLGLDHGDFGLRFHSFCEFMLHWFACPWDLAGVAFSFGMFRAWLGFGDVGLIECSA